MEIASTSSAYNSVLASLMAEETQQTNLSNQISSGQTATDLQGYGSKAETLTAMQSVQAQVTGYLANAQNTAAVLSTQNTALTQVGSAAKSATQAVTTALASGDGSTLMQALQSAFQGAVEGLNTTYDGNYVFAGGNSATAPVNISNLSSLASAPSVASVFTNDQTVTTTQITPSTSAQTGFLASQLGTPLFTALQAIAQYDSGPNGPFGSTLTSAQQTFLQGEIASLQSAGAGLTDATSQNGLVQQQVTNAQTALGDQQTTLTNMINNITQVDLAKASSNLAQTQLAVQASSRVFVALQSSSLLAVLTASGH